MENLSLSNTALIIVDMQKDFGPGGALPVPEREGMVDNVNSWIQRFEEANGILIYTFDWHPDTTPHFDKWPVHGVAFSKGASLDNRMYMPFYPYPIYSVSKGIDQEDGYSAFEKTEIILHDESFYYEGLEKLLHELDIDTLYVIGKALDYCVFHTAADALDKGFKVVLPLSATAGVVPEACEDAIDFLMRKGAQVLERGVDNSRMNVL